MSLVQRYLQYPYFILPVLFLGVVLGIKSFWELPLNLFPDANYPSIVVVLQIPGASAEDVEKQVAIQVEKELATLSLVRRVRSVSRDGVAVVSAEFEYEKGLSAAQVDVSAALDRIVTDLPPGLLPPRIYKVSDATKPVMTLAVTSAKDFGLGLAQVRRLAQEYIKPLLLNDPAIGDVEVFGGYGPEVLVEVDRDTLARYSIGLAEVAAALSSGNANLPSGVIRTSKKDFYIKIEGEVDEPERLASITIPYKGHTLRLGDLARISVTHQDRQSLFHGNGRPAIGVNILRPESGDVMATIEAAKRELSRLRALYPTLEFSVVDTQEEVIQTSVSNLVGALRDAVILTVAVIFLLMARMRATLLAAVSIPLTYFLTFFLMKLFGMELNIVTMTAVILAVGLLVDDSIVVAENIERHLREKGLSPREAAISGTREIMLADFSGTFTTILVLIPIMFVGGYVERILRELAVVLTMALSASYVVSVTVIPLLAPYVLRGKGAESRVERFLMHWSEAFLDLLRRFYLSLFRFGMRHRLLTIVPALLVLGLSARGVIPLVGRDLMPPMDTGIMKVSFELAPNMPVEASGAAVAAMEERIMKTPGFVRMATAMGSEPGVISFGADRTPRQGVITTHFVDRFQRDWTIWEMEEALYRDFTAIPGLKSVHVFEFGATPLSSIAAPVDVMISGKEPSVIHNLALEIEDALRGARGLASLSHTWDFDRIEYRVVPDLERLARYGLGPKGLAAALSAAFGGRPASIWRIDEERPYTIRVRYPGGERGTPLDLLDFMVPTPSGPVPLRELATVTEGFTRGIIVREGLFPVIDVLGYRRTAAVSHIQANVEKAMAEVAVPGGVTITQAGEVRPMQAAFGRLKNALALSLILLYFSLVPTFRSLKHPLTIMIAIPLALIGAIWGLLAVGRHFCMPASMGMVLLSGVVVNNSILLIDFIERAREHGVALRDAIEASIRDRTRPILMTALSTVAGMVPIASEQAIGLERLSPLAVVAIGGLLVGTVLTLVYIPLFYAVFDSISRKAAGLAGHRR